MPGASFVRLSLKSPEEIIVIFLIVFFPAKAYNEDTK